MRRQLSDLGGVIVIAGLSAILTLVAPANSIVRPICAVPLVLFLPGYAITIAMFPRRSLGLPEQVLFSLGLSLAVTALAGLALNLTPWGLQTATWAVALFAIVLLAGAVAWQRRKQAGAITIASASVPFKLSVREGLLFGLAVLVVGVTLNLTQMPVSPNGVSGYTVLWMVPAGDGKANDYRLGVTSNEFAALSYRLQVSVDGRLIQEWPELKLAPGDSWTATIELRSDQVGSGAIETALYRLDNPASVYRQVKLWREE